MGFSSSCSSTNPIAQKQKEGLTLDEKRICLRGDRALKALADECRRVIWAHIYRSNFSHRIPREEMYQIGLMCVELAANTHNPNKPGKQRSFKSWVALKLRGRLINRFDKEFRYHRRGKAYCEQLIHSNGVTDEYTPDEFVGNRDLSAKLEHIIQTSLTGKQAQVFQDYYLHNQEPTQIANRLDLKVGTVWKYNQLSRQQLRNNPQLRELAEMY
ncbi:MAG: sigma-70 family RNA polymerase sigma factor [Acaryochloris sp. CRU_2_0]|nr:sigma-70 family RNA polymerase sigma factor [Acaryochloris sp. CRU_2_0]